MHTRILICLAALLGALLPLRAADNLLITEFMAANSGTLADEDGAYSDWLEIYNAGANTVNLGGWYLTDNAGNLTKWQFPSTNMAPHTFLIVFASGKNRAVPGAPLHTSFSLSAGGEYLALVRPDGVTVASQFAPQFPNQFNDVAYGYVMSGTTTTLLPTGAPARAFVPTTDIGTAWRGTNFDDTAWTAGVTAVGYDQGTNYTSSLGLNLGAAMSNANASAYVRVPFNVTDPGHYEALTLRMRYDDGFIAYLNGTEVARRNAPASPAWNSTATRVHGPPNPGSLVENFEGGASQFVLNQYGVVPPPSVQPAGAGSTGSFLRLLTDGINNAINGVTFRQTAPGLFQEIIADFDFRMANAANNPADGWAFMLIPTSIYGTNGPGLPVPAGIEEPNFPGVFAIGVDVYPHTTQNDVSVHWNASEKVNVTMPRGTFELVANQFHHMHVVLQHVTGGARVTVTLTADVNGTPGAPYTPIDNLFVPGLNPYDCRVEFGARTGGLNHQLDLDNINVQFVPGNLAFEEIDLTSQLPLLQPGQNVLAIQGLNVSAADADFLISPEITAADFVVGTNADYLAPATPGTWNNVNGAGTVSPVTFSQPAGAYTSNSLTVALASSSSSAEIRYTLNGANPTGSSLLYTGALTITSNTVIRARAIEPGKVDSEITSANYILVDSTMTNFTSNLPLVIIDSMGGTIVAETKIPSYLVLLNTNTPSGRTHFDGPSDFTGRAGVELHGQSSLGFPKQSMNVETDTETDKDRKVSLLGAPKGSDWVLYAPYTDKTFMNDVLAYDLHEAMGHYAVRRKYVEVFVRTTSARLTTNDYRGIYVLLEKIRIDENRVNISEPQSGTPDDPITGGYIFKRDKGSPGSTEFQTLNQPYTIAANGVAMQFHDPRGDQLTPVQRQWLIDYLNEYESVLYGPNWRDPKFGYLKYIDPASFVDQHWIVEFPKNIDGYRLSDYMNKDRNRPIQMEPIWDWNLSFGNANYLEGGLTNNWYYPQLGAGDDIWLSRLRTDPDFYQRIIDRWGELRTNVFALSNLIARVDRYTNLLWEAQARDFVRWPRLGTYVWPNPDGPNRTSADAVTLNFDIDYTTPTTYSALIGEMKKWITGRFTWIDRQFLVPPSLSLPSGFIAPGATLTITGTLGSVYYTLDGTDPRAPGGAVSSSAYLYTGPITLTNNSGVFARSIYTNRWSAPGRGVYVVTTPSLRISEIMYHPSDPPTNSSYDEDDFEYVEIRNTGANTIDLAGARLGGGIDFTFVPSTLVPTGIATSNNFDGGGTPFTASTLNSGPAATITSVGPSDSFLRLITGGTTNLTRNRVAFDRTASGGYGRVTADFDFRANTAGPNATNGAPTLQDFDGTAGNAAYVLAGSATAMPVEPGTTGGFLRLVPATGSLSGTVGFERTAPGSWNTVVATFDFRITPPSEANQADGMGFALLNTANYGVSGAAPGISEEVNLTASLGLGIDVYNNGAPNDPNNNHLSLHYGALVGTVTPPFDLSNGHFHRAQMIVRFSGGKALVTVRLTPDINVAVNPVPVTLFQDVPVNGVNPYEMRAAFGARTGGQVAMHDIDNVNLQFLNEVDTTAGLSMLLLPTGTFGATGAGSTLASFVDAPTLTNGLAIDLAFHPSNYLNDAAIYWNAAPVIGSFLPPSSFDLDNGAWHHARAVIDSYPGGAYVTVTLSPGAAGGPGTVVLASNLFVAGLNAQDWRVEFAGRNGFIDTSLDINNVVVNYQTFASLLLAPGESILVVKNREAFESRYGSGYRIAGEFSGQLDNSGDHIVLLGPVGEPIADFTYSDDWYRLTDGSGFSLVANPDATDFGSAGSWRNSTYPGGSPGAPDPVLNIPPVVINEVLANSVLPEVDRIELFNPTTNSVNIGGWFLSDDFASPRKFRIPDGTTIAAGGFAVFSEADFNPTPGAGSSFALGSDGDEVWLFSGDASTNLTGYVHGFDFGGSDENVSFGRYVDASGAEDFPPQISNTFGAPNAGPRVGPVVISEVMYHPPDSSPTADNQQDEFIELANLSGTPVPLYSTALPTDTWRLRQAVDFDFPPNVTLAGGERILVVSFDPTNAAAADAFRATYHLAPAVRLFGPYAGKLDNSSDDIHLNRPLPPGTNGTVYVRVDKVNYKDSAPWPVAADGYGPSLQRRASELYGNEPTNWVAAVPTPGAAWAPGGAPAINSQPSDVTLLGGGNTAFSVTATGTGLRFQWRANGTNIVGATNSILMLNDVQITQGGDYHVAVFNDAGAVLSSNAHLTVIAPVTFTVQPASQNVSPGTNVTLSVAAVAFGPVTYQWKLNGTNLPGATNATYSFTNASLANHGLYQVTATDGYSSADSAEALVFVLIRPGYLQQPVAQSVVQGGSAVFSVIVTGAPPIWYRWIRGGTPYLTSSVPYLVLTNVQTSTSIRVAVTNMATGLGGLNSSTVQLTVLADFDGDGIADAWETNYAGFSTNSAADGLLDFDGDGMNNHDEYVAGTDPTDPLSVLKLVMTATNAPTMRFVAQSNITYTVQYSTDLTSNVWWNATNIFGSSSVRTIEVNAADSPADKARFYRVVTPVIFP